TAEGHFLGRLDGFRFTLDESATSEEIKTLRSASMSALAAEFKRRSDKLYLSPDSEIDVTDQGGLMWGTDAVGKLEKGESPLAPSVQVFVDDFAGPDVAEKVQRRLTHWISRKIAALFEPLVQMRDDEAVTGLAKGVAFQLVEAMGIIPRPRIAEDIKQLAQEDRALLRKHGVRFGQHNIFLPALLKPAPARMRLVLWALWQDLPEFPEAPPAGHVTFPGMEGVPEGYYEIVGYRLSGQRAVRIDMLERLADLLRPMDVRGGFEATPDMLSITGCTLEQLADVLGSLGFKGARGERPKPPRPAPEANTEKDAGAEPTPATENDPVAVPAESTDTPAQAAYEEAPVETASNEAAPVAVEVKAEAAETGAVELEAAADGTTGDIPSLTEPEIEVFYTFTLARRPRPHGDRSQGSRQSQGRGRGTGGEKPEGKQSKRRRGQGGKPMAEGDRPPRQGKPKPKTERREAKIDPDSPFAILQQLKNK
ncbi:MAG: disulfide oxidoreductase, partial [Pseudomonadota bacterium]